MLTCLSVDCMLAGFLPALYVSLFFLANSIRHGILGLCRFLEPAALYCGSSHAYSLSVSYLGSQEKISVPYCSLLELGLNWQDMIVLDSMIPARRILHYWLRARSSSLPHEQSLSLTSTNLNDVSIHQLQIVSFTKTHVQVLQGPL